MILRAALAAGMNGSVRAAAFAAAAGVAVALTVGVPLLLLWFRPGLGMALAVATWLSLLVTVPWALMADLTIGVPAPLGLTFRDPAGSAARLLAGTSGNAAEFAAVTGGLTVACFLVAGWRTRRAPAPERPVRAGRRSAGGTP